LKYGKNLRVIDSKPKAEKVANMIPVVRRILVKPISSVVRNVVKIMILLAKPIPAPKYWTIVD
jgi:hypothetical protein